jgi:hypothetical protein
MVHRTQKEHDDMKATCLNHIQEVSGSNFGHDTNYHDRFFMVFLSPLLQENYGTVPYNRLHSTSFPRQHSQLSHNFSSDI